MVYLEGVERLDPLDRSDLRAYRGQVVFLEFVEVLELPVCI